MPVERRIWRRRPITLTPLIDIIFLLLLFFMLSSSFTRFGELPLVNAAGGVPPSGQAPLFVQLGADGLRLNGTDLSLAALPQALARIADGAGGETRTLLLSLDDEVTSQALVELLVLLQAESWLAVSVLG